MLAGIAAAPWLDRRGDDIGVYFRSTVGRKTALAGLILGLVLVPALVVIDEFWLDLPGLLPALPTLISNGLIPLLLSLGGLAAIYLLMRRGLQANRSEAFVGLFVFVIVSFHPADRRRRLLPRGQHGPGLAVLKRRGDDGKRLRNRELVRVSPKRREKF